MTSLCKFPLFNFSFSIPLPDLPGLPNLDFSIDLDLSCPLDF